jgi:hypothetical protein
MASGLGTTLAWYVKLGCDDERLTKNRTAQFENRYCIGADTPFWPLARSYFTNCTNLVSMIPNLLTDGLDVGSSAQVRG